MSDVKISTNKNNNIIKNTLGQTTSILCNHNLDVSSIDALAKDLSIRLRATISYGYYTTYFINEENKLDNTFDFVQMGNVVYNDSEVKYVLEDQNYGARKFIEQNGIEILNNIEADSYLRDELLEKNQSIEFEFNEISNNSDHNFVAYIYQKTIDLWTVDSMTWSFFQRMFYYKLDNEDFDFLKNWRLESKEWIAKFGGNFMFVYSYENPSNEITTILEENYLDKSTAIIREKFPNNLVNISTYILSETYRDKPDYIREPFSKSQSSKMVFSIDNKINLSPVKVDYPILFYDDFKDLDSNFNGNNYFNFVYNGDFIFEAERKNNEFETNFKIKREHVELPNLDNYFKIYNCFITGFKHYENISLFNNLFINQELFLIREPQNQYNKNAIGVYPNKKSIKVSERLKLGYIPKEENYILSKLLDNGYVFKCFITSISDNEYYNHNYNYVIKMSIYLLSNNKK